MARDRRNPINTRPSGRQEERIYYGGDLVSETRTERIFGDDRIPTTRVTKREMPTILDCGHVSTEGYFVLPDGRMICQSCAQICQECGQLFLGREIVTHDGRQMHYDCYLRLLRRQEREQRGAFRREVADQVKMGIVNHFLRKLTLIK